MVDFVCVTAKRIARQWDVILQHDASWYNLEEVFVEFEMSDTDREHWIATGVLRCLELSSEFARRVMVMVTTYPCLMAWLIFSPPHTECTGRKDACC